MSVDIEKKNIRKKITNLYRDSEEITEKQYRNSRAMFIADSCVSTQIFTVTSGAFLSGLAYLAGASTAWVAIISALPTLMNVVQILSSVVYENRTSSKKITIQFAVIQRLCLISMLFVPMLPWRKDAVVALIAVLYSCAHFCGAFINTGANNWLMSLAQKSRLGRYLGIKDSLVLVASIAGSLCLSKVLDSYRAVDREMTGFQIIGIISIGFFILDFIFLSLIVEPKNKMPEQRLRIKSAILMPLKDAKYQKVIVFYLIWSIASNIAGPFFSIYMLEDLGLSYFYITIMNMVASIGRMVASLIWGKIADTCSWNLVTSASIAMLGVAYIGWSILTKENCTYWLPIVQCVSGIAWGGIGISTFRLQFEHAPQEHKVSYVSFCSTMAGVAGFLASMLGSGFVAAFQEVTIGSITIHNIQVIFLISAFGILASAIYSKKFKEI